MKVPAPILALVRRLLGWAPVVRVRAVMDRYGAAGGGLLAGGLTYSALFALLPSLLLVTAVLGFVVDDPERRRTIVAGIAESLPPLSGFVEASLDQITDGAAGAGTIGLFGLAWGASRFYGSLDDAFARIFSSAQARGFLARTVRGFVSVVLLVSVFLVALILTGIASYLADRAGGGVAGDVPWQLITPGLTIGVFVVGVAFIYRVVPARHVPWGSILAPALIVGVLLGVLTQLFSFVAPRLIGTAAVFGTFVAIFAAMVWLSTSFQVLLLGAAWLRERIGEPPPPFVQEG